MQQYMSLEYERSPEPLNISAIVPELRMHRLFEAEMAAEGKGGQPQPCNPKPKPETLNSKL